MKTNHLILTALLTGTLALAGCDRDGGMDTTADRANTGTDTGTGTGAGTGQATDLDTPPGMTGTERDAWGDTQAGAENINVTDVHLGTEVDDNHAVTSPQTAFASDDENIHLSVTTVSDSNAPATATIGVRWTFEDGQLIDERSAALEFTDRDTTSFHVNNTDGWPMGTYNVEVTLNGEAVERRQFTIQ